VKLQTLGSPLSEYLCGVKLFLMCFLGLTNERTEGVSGYNPASCFLGLVNERTTEDDVGHHNSATPVVDFRIRWCASEIQDPLLSCMVELAQQDVGCLYDSPVEKW
jgi:hypothetical protein